MDDIKIVVALLLGAVLFPYLTIMLAIMRYERRSCKKMEEAMIKEKYTKHGYWIEECTGIICSECLAEYSDEIVFMNRNCKQEDLNFCPNCGAKMDGGKESDL